MSQVRILPGAPLRPASTPQFAETYREKRFDPAHYELDDGHLQTTLSDDSRMPLRFFVEYDNAWWFEIVTAVDVPPRRRPGQRLGLHRPRHPLRGRPPAGRAARALRRIVDQPHLRGGRVLRPITATGRARRNGNRFWPETGYHPRESALAAQAFLGGATGREFVAREPTAAPVMRIRANLDELLTQL
ncbi:hypothetical protein [Actinomycetospora sp. NBC_00405]|uniref:hypothetical protein n=1 Tax=Actinomycetospora sp. NBC_00405 TaxID=2975952 RepID=UPI002E22FA1E